MSSPAAAAPGLRELKKQRTRATIADAALQLFISRGFATVTVAEVARAAEVSEATVFNYFRTKEDLVYDRLEQFWTRFIGAVEHRPDGQGVVDAVEGFLLNQEPTALAPEQQERLSAINRMIAESPALLAREQASYDQAATALADVIARTTSIRADAAAAAHLVLGVHKSLVAYTREQVLAGTDGATLNRRVAARTRSGYSLLRRGLTI
jgi:AcrR family transcriptional regulator